VSNAQSAAHGPSAAWYAVDWMKDRFAGNPCATKFIKVDGAGNVHESCIEDARKALSLVFLPQPSRTSRLFEERHAAAPHAAHVHNHMLQGRGPVLNGSTKLSKVEAAGEQ